MKCLVFVITYNKALIKTVVYWWVYIDYKGENPVLMDGDLIFNMLRNYYNWNLIDFTR